MLSRVNDGDGDADGNGDDKGDGNDKRSPGTKWEVGRPAYY